MTVSKDSIELSVIVTTQNNLARLQQCLDSILDQSLESPRYEVIIVDRDSRDGTWEWLQRAPVQVNALRAASPQLQACKNQALQDAQGRWVLFLRDDTLATHTLLETHISTHLSRPEKHICVLGHLSPCEADLEKPLMRYLMENDVLYSFHTMMPMAKVPPSDFHSLNVSIPLNAILQAGGFDVEFTTDTTAQNDLGFRLDNLGFDVLYQPKAKAIETRSFTLEQIKERQTLIAHSWVHLFQKHPDRVREWGDFRHMDRKSFQETLAQCAESAHQREELIIRLNEFRFDSDPNNPTSNPETQRRLLQTMDEHFQILNSLWWAQGLDDGLGSSGLDGFQELLERSGHGHELEPDRTVVFLSQEPSQSELQQIFKWSARHDEYTPGGLVVVVNSSQESRLENLAAKLACIVHRAQPRGKPAAIRMMQGSLHEHTARALFQAMDHWLLLNRAGESGLLEVATAEHCQALPLQNQVLLQGPELPGTLRVGIWPDWNGYSDMLHLIDKWWPALSAREDCALVLFHTHRDTKRAKRSAETLQELLDKSSDGVHAAHVITALISDHPDEMDYWRQQLDGMIIPPSAYNTEKLQWMNQLSTRTFVLPIDLERHLVTLQILADELLGHAGPRTDPRPWNELQTTI